jgi:hypothetical protein
MLKRYTVTIEETCSRTIAIWADDSITAAEIAEELCNAGALNIGDQPEDDFTRNVTRCTESTGANDDLREYWRLS